MNERDKLKPKIFYTNEEKFKFYTDALTGIHNIIDTILNDPENTISERSRKKIDDIRLIGKLDDLEDDDFVIAQRLDREGRA